jgi:hypothetical protein
MFIRSIVLSTVVCTSLAGCLANNNERGLAGAATGAVIGGVAGGNPLTGAVVGGAAGYFCHDLNVAGCTNQ